MRNGNTSVAPAARPPAEEAPLLRDVGVAEELGDAPTGWEEPEEDEVVRGTGEREVGTSSCLHLLTRCRTPSLMACPP